MALFQKQAEKQMSADEGKSSGNSAVTSEHDDKNSQNDSFEHAIQIGNAGIAEN